MSTKQQALFTAFNAQATRLSQKGATANDIKRITKYANETACGFAQTAIDAGIVASMTNQKSIMRLAQSVAFIASGTTDALDPVTACIIASVVLTKQQTIKFADLHYLVGGRGNDDTAHIRGVSRQKLDRFIGLTHCMGTVTSKVSRSVGKGGFLQALGITSKGDAHSFTLTESAKNHPFVLAYAARLQSLTDGQFALLADKVSK